MWTRKKLSKILRVELKALLTATDTDKDWKEQSDNNKQLGYVYVNITYLAHGCVDTDMCF